MGHRPMYCVASPGGDPARCDGEHEASRSGTPAACGVRDGNFHNCDPRSDEYPAEPELEGLLHAHGVDVAMYGHIHLYARFWPTLRGKVLATGPGAYSDPPATVFITNGGGGNHEMRLGQGGAPSSGECPAPWCAFESGWRGGRDNALSADFGYARIAVANASHLAWEQVSATRGGAVVDAWTLVRSSGAPAFGRRALSRRLSALRQR